MEKHNILIGYQEDVNLRNSFNRLSKKTFGLCFEDWYKSGYWKEQYIPYSIIIDGEVISNVSVNRMDFVIDGSKKHYIQLGTVMTDERYRKQGYGRILMERVLNDYKECDGIYLFANDSVIDFYPRFGFYPVKEYQYAGKVEINKESLAGRLNMEDKETRIRFLSEIKNMKDYGRMEMKNDGLLMFYILYFMKDNVYYVPELSTYVIAEINNTELFIHAVYSRDYVPISEICHTFGRAIEQVALGFTPKDAEGFSVRLLKEDDTTLFVLGKGWADLEGAQMMFPTLSHA